MGEGFPLIVVLFAAGFMVVSLALFVMVARASGMRFIELRTEEDGEGPGVEPPERPWWGSPLLWFAVGSASLLLGLLVAPHFFGGAIVFLPFIWIGGRRRR